MNLCSPPASSYFFTTSSSRTSLSGARPAKLSAHPEKQFVQKRARPVRNAAQKRPFRLSLPREGRSSADPASRKSNLLLSRFRQTDSRNRHRACASLAAGVLPSSLAGGIGRAAFLDADFPETFCLSLSGLFRAGLELPVAVMGAPLFLLESSCVTSSASSCRSKSLVFIGFTSSLSAPSSPSESGVGYAVSMAIAGL